MFKQLRFLILLLFLAGFIPDEAFAQFPYSESFMNSTAPGMNLGGTASLTSGTGSDAVGNGYLRLTNVANSQAGYAYSSNSFPSSKGISVSFEYYTYGGNGADGICFFLFDATTTTFNVGSYGGGLGYTNVSSAGLSNGYLGIGLDEYGNFSDPGAGGNGGPGRVTNSVTIRGAYNDSNGAYAYLTTVPVQTNYSFPIGSSSSTRPTVGGSGYRKAYIDITPHAGSGYDITVKIQHDAVSTPVTVISNYYYNKAAPANLKFGYAASTGGSTNYHEIRNVGVTLPAGSSVVAPTQTNQTLTSCSNSTGSVNISSGFSTTNSPNGAINTASVDLDPANTGIQTTYTVTNKGTFTSDGNGNITFTPLNNAVTGTAVGNFTVADNYGATSNTATVTATINAAPNLVVTNPAAACSPSTVDLTATAVTAGSDASLTLTYYTNSAATTSLTNPNAVASSGTYYIKAVNANGCSVTQPVTVTINPQPTTANAGVNQNVTAATPTSVTLNGNVAAVGTGLWSQVSGPSTATFANAALRNTSVSNLNPGSYVFRWTITNGCGSSLDDVTITITGTQTITFASFPAKTYGAADFNAGATASSGLTVTYTSSNSAVATVDATGLVHILSAGTTNITASQAGNSNYAAATAVVRTLTVNKAPLTITADNQNKPYGAANPILTASYTGFVNGDTNTSLTAQPAISTTATTASAVGTYPITASGATSNNYTIAYAAGTLTVSQSSQTITFNSTVPAKTYGDVNFSSSATSTSGLAVTYTSSNPAVATVDASGTVHILSAGSTTITASQSGNSNYSAATPVTQNITVNKASLTIAADNQNKAYGSGNPALTASYVGFVNGDTNTSLTTQPTVSTAATAASAAGTYPITASGATSNNYTINYTAGTLTIGQASQNLSFASLPAKTYGNVDFNAGVTSSSGLLVAYTSSNPAVATVDAAGIIHILSAGSTTITASQSGNGNYSAASSVIQNLTVNKASLTIAADNQNKAYGSSNPTLTASYVGFVNGDTNASLTNQPTVSTTATAASATGTYPISISGAASNNYTISYTAGTLTVGQSNQSITFNALPAKTYGDADFTLSGNSSSGLPVTYTSSDASIATVTGNMVHILKAGTVTISASQAGNGNYNAATSILRTLTINPATLIITANNQTKTYNTANPALTLSYSGFVNGDTPTSLTTQPTSSTTATAASSVGNYPINVSGAANNNYTITYVNGVLTVGQSTPTVTFNALSAKTYGDADFSLSASSSAGLPITYTSSNPLIATVDASGTVHILSAGTVTITASQAGNGNYSPATSVQQILTINKASLTVTANSQSKTYGSANPVFTASYSGFVNGDTNSSLTTQPTIATTATAASATGTYPITASGATSNNYNISYVNGSLAILPGVQTITFTAAPKTYGDADFTLTATASSGLPINYSSSNTAVATVDANGVVHIVSAGTVTITASQAGNGNYVPTTNLNQQLVINKAALTITADNQNKAFGAANPALTVSYSGFVNGDTNASLTVQPVVSTTVTTASAVGTYPVTVSGAASANYNITYQSGTLNVGQSSQTITFAALPSKTYGDADFGLAASASSGSPVAYSSSNQLVATVDAAGNVHILSAGTTVITASQAGNNNYNAAIPVTQNLTVNKASLTVTADNQSKTYGSANPALTISYSGFVNGDTQTGLTTQPTISTTATTASAAGTYPITITNATASNYNLIYTAGNLMVIKAALTIKADNQTRVLGLANPPLTVSYTGFINGDTQASLTTQPTISTTATTASAAGIYPITVSGATSNNYTITYQAGTLTVTNATINSVSLAQATLYENRPIGTLAGTLAATSLDPNAIYTYSLIAGAGSTDNSYFSIQGNKLLTAQSLDYEQKANYQILVRTSNQYGLYLDQTFTINLSDVNEAPTLAAIVSQSVCNIPSTQTITLTGITPGPETAQTTTVSVSSTNPGLFNLLNVSNVINGSATLTYQLATTGTAIVTVTVKDNGGTANGGVDSFSQTFMLTSNDLPVAIISSDKGTQISKGETVTLTATGGSAYSWDTTPNVSGTQSSATIKVRPSQTTTYQVKVTNASGCNSTSSITILVNDDYTLIHAANLLTPNGDGKNDTWVVKNLDLYPDNTVSIFDRGGRKLLEVKHYNNDWNGTYQGSPLAEGTYYYIIDFGPGKGPMKGFITILRNR